MCKVVTLVDNTWWIKRLLLLRCQSWNRPNPWWRRWVDVKGIKKSFESILGLQLFNLRQFLGIWCFVKELTIMDLSASGVSASRWVVVLVVKGVDRNVLQDFLCNHLLSNFIPFLGCSVGFLCIREPFACHGTSDASRCWVPDFPASTK